MKVFLRIACLALSFFLTMNASAQQRNNRQDSIVQLYGVVMTADSLQGLDGASVIVEGRGRGTITNAQGVFSIVVLKGDVVRFSSVGYKDNVVRIPNNLESNQYSVIELLTNDTNYLPATILKPRPTRAQFERDFVNADVPADQYEIARQNTDEAKRRILIASLPSDGREAFNQQVRGQVARAYYAGQAPPMNILSPFAWNEFIRAWKRGDFKRKRSK